MSAAVLLPAGAAPHLSCRSLAALPTPRCRSCRCNTCVAALPEANQTTQMLFQTAEARPDGYYGWRMLEGLAREFTQTLLDAQDADQELRCQEWVRCCEELTACAKRGDLTTLLAFRNNVRHRQTWETGRDNETCRTMRPDNRQKSSLKLSFIPCKIGRPSDLQLIQPCHAREDSDQSLLRPRPLRASIRYLACNNARHTGR